MDSIPTSERSSGEGKDNPLQYSCLEHPMDRGAWGAAVRRVTKRDVTERLSARTHTQSTRTFVLDFISQMAPHSSALAWGWTEEPGGLQSMGSQRVGHD